MRIEAIEGSREIFGGLQFLFGPRIRFAAVGAERGHLVRVEEADHPRDVIVAADVSRARRTFHRTRLAAFRAELSLTVRKTLRMRSGEVAVQAYLCDIVIGPVVEHSGS